MSSGTPETWRPLALPRDVFTRSRLQEWLGATDRVLNIVGGDFRGADLSGGRLSSTWLTECDFRDVKLRDVDLYRAHLEGANFAGADLSGATLGRAVLDESDLRGAVLDDASLTSASIWGADMRYATFRRCGLAGASILAVDARGADFSSAVLKETGLRLRVDEATRFNEMSGEFRGSMTVHWGGVVREIIGAELQYFLRSRGSDAHVLEPFRKSGQWA